MLGLPVPSWAKDFGDVLKFTPVGMGENLSYGYCLPFSDGFRRALVYYDEVKAAGCEVCL